MPKFIKRTELVAKPAKAPRGKGHGFLLEGMKDIMPSEQKYWQLIKNRVEQLARDYGFEKIDTPLLEKTVLFEKGLGKQSEAIATGLISFADQGGENVVLRPAATLSVARAYLDHGLANWPQPVKLYYCGPMFRRDQPHSNNLCQFHQFGFEVFGSANPIIDAQLILIAFNFYKDIGVPATVQINSVGCQSCRAEYRKALNNYYRQYRNLLCHDCKDQLSKNPLKVFQCRENKCRELREEAPQIVDYLCEECKSHFIKVLEYLDELELPYILNADLVKDVSYGTRTIFKIWPEEADSSTNSLAAGGRYDDLLMNMANQAVPACGFAVGIERAIAKIKKEELVVPGRETYDVFLAQLGEQARRKALVLFENLKEKGIKVAESFAKDGLKPQLEMANKLGVKFALILGQKEVLDGTIMIRDMEGGVQEVVDFNKITLEVQKRLMKQ